jgi:hypothetical protein
MNGKLGSQAVIANESACTAALDQKQINPAPVNGAVELRATGTPNRQALEH